MFYDNTRQGVIFCTAVVLAFTLIAFPVFAAQEIGEPIIRNFESDEYGGHLQVWSIAEDHRGVMYFGTWTELIEFEHAAAHGQEVLRQGRAGIE